MVDTLAAQRNGIDVEVQRLRVTPHGYPHRRFLGRFLILSKRRHDRVVDRQHDIAVSQYLGGRGPGDQTPDRQRTASLGVLLLEAIQPAFVEPTLSGGEERQVIELGFK